LIAVATSSQDWLRVFRANLACNPLRSLTFLENGAMKLDHDIVEGGKAFPITSYMYPKDTILKILADIGFVGIRTVKTQELQTDKYGNPKEMAEICDEIYTVFVATRPNQN